MYSQVDLTNEIKQLIERAIENKTPTGASFIAKTIVDRHPFPKTWRNRDSEFACLCRERHVRNCVHTVLSTMKTLPEPEDDQLTLPGWEHLQKAYIAKRGGELALIRLDVMTDAELDAKADDYERMGTGCLAHAKELRRYRRERAAAA